jgi:hypothetical protein
MGAWLTPSPSRKRFGQASAIERPPAAIAIGSRAQMLAMPLATTSLVVALRKTAAWTSASRASASPYQRVP